MRPACTSNAAVLVVAGTADTAIGMEATVAHLLALGVRAGCTLVAQRIVRSWNRSWRVRGIRGRLPRGARNGGSRRPCG